MCKCLNNKNPNILFLLGLFDLNFTENRSDDDIEMLMRIFVPSYSMQSAILKCNSECDFVGEKFKN